MTFDLHDPVHRAHVVFVDSVMYQELGQCTPEYFSEAWRECQVEAERGAKFGTGSPRWVQSPHALARELRQRSASLMQWAQAIDGQQLYIEVLAPTAQPVPVALRLGPVNQPHTQSRALLSTPGGVQFTQHHPVSDDDFFKTVTEL